MNNKEKKNKYNREIYKNNKEEFKKDNRWVRRTRRGTYRTRLNNPSVVGAMNNLFRYQAIQVEDLEDVYYQIQDGKVKWLVKTLWFVNLVLSVLISISPPVAVSMIILVCWTDWYLLTWFVMNS